MPFASSTEGQFSVSLSSKNDPVGEGSQLSVDVLVDNTDAEAGEKTIEMYVEGVLEDAQTVSVSGGGSETVTLNWTPEFPERGTRTVSVESPDNTITFTVEVLEPTFATVNILSSNSPVNEVDTLEIEAIIANAGEQSGSKDAILDVPDGTQHDVASVSLDGYGAKVVPLTWSPESGDAGTYDAKIYTNDDDDIISVEILEYPREIDDFEEKDLSKYTGDTGAYSFVESKVAPVSESSVALKYNSPGSNSYKIVLSDEELTPDRGELFSYWCAGNNNINSTQIRFGYQDSNNWYRLMFKWWDTKLILQTYENDSTTDRTAVNSNISRDGTWYYVEISWGNTINAKVWNESQDPGTDTPIENISITNTSFDTGDLVIECGSSGSGENSWIDEIYSETDGQ